MKITEDSFSLYRTAEQAISNEETHQRGMAETPTEFIKTIAEVHANA